MKFADIETKLRGCITKGIRDAFKRCEKYKTIKVAARVEKPRYKQDGTLAKKPQVFYKCNACKELTKSTDVHVDHVTPVIGLDQSLSDLSFNEYVYNVFNLPCQVLCTKCHKAKTKEENAERRRLKK